MPSPKKQAPTEDKSLQPASSPLETLAPDLGLGPTTSVQNVRDALEALLDRARKIELPPETKKAFDTVDGAYRPPAPGYLPFDAQIVPLGGSSIRNVKEAIAVLRRAVEVASVQVTEPSRAEGTEPARQEDFSSLRFPRKNVERYRDRLSQHNEPAHIGDLMTASMAELSDPAKMKEREEKAKAVVAPIREALEYLVKHGVIPPTACKGNKPPEEKIARYGIVWLWKDDIQRYDPRFRPSQKPSKRPKKPSKKGEEEEGRSLFTASKKYFSATLEYYKKISFKPPQPKKDLIDECIRALDCKEPSEESLQQEAAREITGRPTSEATIRRWVALYRFLKATNAFNDTH